MFVHRARRALSGIDRFALYGRWNRGAKTLDTPCVLSEFSRSGSAAGLAKCKPAGLGAFGGWSENLRGTLLKTTCVAIAVFCRGADVVTPTPPRIAASAHSYFGIKRINTTSLSSSVKLMLAAPEDTLIFLLFGLSVVSACNFASCLSLNCSGEPICKYAV